ncbi:class I SAM-dependent RNA methyltransferase [Aeromicrobium piscarium]|uniref:Class I SAM-dependent RNA methyltransferase n=1 Tax=Aeromicrobium piscarium TaxID=2590901 RepID=A0A554SG21_9ACTN|nr:class I SAM-dependent RNA methyltransferase [Aeromicrobium piscarium]TSD65287.1 class I SAM-dependent RNA methyltransferase [Aeromicrobium piscarium]
MSSERPIVDIGPVAHGGHCVARLDGQVVFVRHALPGERARIEITERSKRFLRADAVEILDASEDRVTPPCRYAGVCGGCDYQHVSPAGQRRLLGSVVSEQLRRLAGLDREVEVEPVSPDDLGWRTRVTYAVDAEGRAGLRRHRSHEVVAIDRCLIAHPDTPQAPSVRWDDGPVEAILSSTGERMVVADDEVPEELGPLHGVVGSDGRVRRGEGSVTEVVREHSFQISGSGFWQVHPGAAGTLVDAVMAGAEVRAADRVLDLYAGAGLFSAFLADATGPTGEVVSVEGARGGHADARANLSGRANVTTTRASVEKALAAGRLGTTADVVVLDPPRAGAKGAVAPIVELGPRRIVYVACDPAALARDLASFGRLGYELSSLRAFALFPMTHHVECVAVLAPVRS